MENLNEKSWNVDKTHSLKQTEVVLSVWEIIENKIDLSKLKSLDENSEELQEIIKQIINDDRWWIPEKWLSTWYISKHEIYWKKTWQLLEDWKIDPNKCLVMLWKWNWTITSSLENPGTYKYVNLFK